MRDSRQKQPIENGWIDWVKITFLSVCEHHLLRGWTERNGRGRANFLSLLELGHPSHTLRHWHYWVLGLWSFLCSPVFRPLWFVKDSAKSGRLWPIKSPVTIQTLHKGSSALGYTTFRHWPEDSCLWQFDHSKRLLVDAVLQALVIRSQIRQFWSYLPSPTSSFIFRTLPPSTGRQCRNVVRAVDALISGKER